MLENIYILKIVSVKKGLLIDMLIEKCNEYTDENKMFCNATLNDYRMQVRYTLYIIRYHNFHNTYSH